MGTVAEDERTPSFELALSMVLLSCALLVFFARACVEGPSPPSPPGVTRGPR